MVVSAVGSCISQGVRSTDEVGSALQILQSGFPAQKYLLPIHTGWKAEKKA
jgi:hypothetical protein